MHLKIDNAAKETNSWCIYRSHTRCVVDIGILAYIKVFVYHR